MTRALRCLAGFFLLLGFPVCAAAQSTLTLGWDANTEPDVVGYVLSWGLRAGEFTASVDVGNVTQWTLSALDPDQRYCFSVQAYTSDPVFSARSTAVCNNRVITASTTGGGLRDDRPSIFWQNRTSGRLLTWHVSGYDVVDTRSLSVPAVTDVNWKIVGSADFNHDGYTDLLWRHQTQGALALWFLQNNAVIGTTMLSVSAVADLNWQIRGAGDVNGDGYADIVWQHSSGSLAVWLMRNQTVLTTQMLTYPTSGSWVVGAVADVNGDQCADLVWQNTATGNLAVWQLRGSKVILTQLLSISSVSDPNWRIQGAGDVDGSGRTAIIWRHQTTGAVALWYLRGTTVIGTAVTNPDVVDDLQWAIVGGR